MMEVFFMITGFIKIIFSIISLYIFLYNCSFINFEIKEHNNILGGITIFVFVLASLIFGNIVFWIN